MKCGVSLSDEVCVRLCNFDMFPLFLTRLAVYPPRPEKGGITITNEDLFCLDHGEFLNDVIIDFYLKCVLLSFLSSNFLYNMQ